MKQDTSSPDKLVSLFSNLPAFQSFLNDFPTKNNLTLSGLSGLSIALFLISFFNNSNKSILVVTNDPNESEYIRDDLDNFSLNGSLCYLPEPPRSSVLFSDIESINSYFINDALRHLTASDRVLVVSTFLSLKIIFPSKDAFRRFGRIFNINDEINRDSFIDILVDSGYGVVDVVESPLDFCVKGGILDFFPPDSLLPYRLEFFGDILESIRTFSPDSQLSINSVSSFSFQPPATTSLLPENSTNIFSYLPNDTVIVCLHADQLHDNPNIVDPSFFSEFYSYSIFKHFDLLSAEISFPVKTAERFLNITDFKTHLSSILSDYPNAFIALFCSDSSHIERFKVLLGIDGVAFFPFSVSSGAELPDGGLFFYTEHEILKRQKRVNFFNKYSRDIPAEKFNPHKISKGDFLVHINYGIGRFSGLVKILAFGSMRECLCIEYLGGDKVFVPLEKLNFVQKYLGGSDNLPQLNKLGSVDWERTKLKARHALDEISKELVALYAKRITTAGFSFSQDNDLQYLMESEFIYDETPDQLTAIREVKEDMERARPMDRLLCGDVGFGKTEVAIRASFKAISNSKQVAVLVPTTILADQHYSVFNKRLEKYPIKIALLSRFVSRKQQSAIIADLARGNIDIVIGTHRLLSNDVLFKDLGLLIIDEEHRFGVKDKERIKFMRESVDVLALSATPIPRSLHFSLIGARDFSVINTPPISRLPVITDVIIFDINIIKNSILREINRGGQVFFVHNNIKTIAALCHKLSLALPNVSIAFAHGQMNVKELENIMSAFINNEINLLVTTTIIESGIDIPNANTIFIDNAHHYGLAQLYQLRGRVGRSNRRAYAYLIVPEPSRIKPDALKKLQTIKKYTALGSGYNVALQDLEIRGAGNLFGASQSGNIEAIGYELYVKFLRESLDDNNVNRAQSSEKIKSDAEVFCPWPAFFPDYFISDPAVRLEYYRQLSVSDDLSSIESVSGAVRDIYGKFPDEVVMLFDISKVRVLSSFLGIKKVVVSDRSAQFLWSESYSPSSGSRFLLTIQQAAASLNISYKFNPHSILHLTLFFRDEFCMEKIICFLNLLSDSINL